MDESESLLERLPRFVPAILVFLLSAALFLFGGGDPLARSGVPAGLLLSVALVREAQVAERAERMARVLGGPSPPATRTTTVAGITGALVVIVGDALIVFDKNLHLSPTERGLSAAGLTVVVGAITFLCVRVSSRGT